MPSPAFYNTCWMAVCYHEAQAFHRARRDVRRTQSRVLSRILRDNRSAWFGQRHRFASLHSVRDFQAAVPLSHFDDYCGAVGRIARGEQQVLTTEPILLLEPTGGTTSGEKLIPYTPALRRSFQRAIRVWIWDLFSKRPAVRRGSAYWSISPMLAARRMTSGGIPIGFDDDAAYLGTIEKMLVERTLAVPPAVALAPTFPACQYATLFFLLRDPRLSLISVWSPTFLTELLTSMWVNRQGLCDDIACGRISRSTNCDSPPFKLGQFRPLPIRAEALRDIFTHAADVASCMRAIWPGLSLVSCWADGPSSTYANNLRRHLDGVELQAKGLLATEAFVSVPLMSEPAPALAIRSHFYEFVPADVDAARGSRPLLAHELQRGARYQVVVTTQGGLYRYQLHDQIEVVGHYGEIPLLRFIGKSDATSDLVGEKLNDAQVEYALQSAFRAFNLTPRFAQLAADAAQARYVLQLCIDSPGYRPLVSDQLAGAVEAELSANPAYRYARELGQLRGVEVKLLGEAEANSITSDFLKSKSAAGRRLGDIKVRVLAETNNAV